MESSTLTFWTGHFLTEGLSNQVLLLISPRKHAYIIQTLKPHYYIVKLGFTGVFIIFPILLRNIDCGCSLEPPRRGGSNEYHNLRFEQKYEKYQNFLFENCPFLGCKIFNIFEQACFRNEDQQVLQAVDFLGLFTHYMRVGSWFKGWSILYAKWNLLP